MDSVKLSGRVIIHTILDNMREQVEELQYSKVVPSAYDVHLHGDDHARFEGLAPEIAAEAVRALQEELDALNRPTRLDRVRELARRPRVPYKKVGPWVVRIARDPEGAVPRGRALVVSQIALAGDSYEGQRTRRIATLSSEPERPPAGDPPAPRRGTAVPDAGPAAPLGLLTWHDESGAHRFPITASEVTVGRDAEGSAADVRLATVADVSRLHVRIRHHPGERRFTIEDLSQFGTAVNGEALERGAPRDLDAPAEIRLAGAITLRFESGAGS